MQASTTRLTSLIALLGLTACGMETREGPAAPVVQVTPRESAPVKPPETEPARTATPKPVVPSKPVTQVYAYQDPAAPPEPEPVPEPAPESAPGSTSNAGTAASAPPATAQAAPGPTMPTSRPAPSSSTAPAPPAPAVAQPAPTASTPAKPPEQTLAKVEPKPPEAPKPPPATPKPQPPLAEAPTPPRSAPRAPSPPAPPLAAPTLPPAAQALASQAEQQRQSGDYAGAAASLERSLRINAPADSKAYLWNRLARVRMEQGQTSQAASFAARSNDLAGGNATVKQDNWRIIAESKRRAGDVAGASEAERRAGAN